MFNDDEDYSSLTGGLGDLDGDGRVDFVEYSLEEDDYRRIMGNKDDDDYSVLGDDDEDWEISYLDTANEYGLNPYDYADKEEFLEALEEARENTDWKENRDCEAMKYGLNLDDFDFEEDFDEALEEARDGFDLAENYDDDDEDDEDEEDDEEDDDEVLCSFSDFDISKLSLTIGANTSLNYDGKPIDQVFGFSEKNENHSVPKSTHKNQQPTQCIERRYYDREDRSYRIGDAIYDNFKEVSDNYEKHECEDFSLLIEKIYRVDKELAINIWVWAIHNFPGALVNRGVDEWNSQAWSLTDRIFNNFASIDNEGDSEKENTFIFRYVSKNPDLEEIIFNKTYVDEHVFSLTEYVPYCVDNNLRDNFLRVYNGIMTNRFRDEKKMSKYSIIEKLLSFCNIYGVREADPWFYAFFEKEIKALNKPLKEAYLMKSLNEEAYGRRVFLKPEKENLELDDEYFGKSDTADEISREEYKKLKNENKALKSKVTRLENRITDLNYCIQRLEKELVAKRKSKEWDGKYYRYCKVTMDEHPNGLWYRTDDITLKKGDYVYVPYGYKNEELMAKVIFVEEFRSDDLPVPLEKMKFIIEKCDA